MVYLTTQFYHRRLRIVYTNKKFPLADPPPEPEKKDNREENIKYIEQEINKELGLGFDKDERIFDFFGEEMIIGLGKDSKFYPNFNSLNSIDIFLGIEVKNQAKMEKLINNVFEKIFSKEMARELGDLKYFISAKPIKKEMNGIDVFVIPVRFLDIYYFFHNGRFYLTISRNSAEQLTKNVDQKNTEIFSKGINRTLDFTGSVKNMLFLANFDELKNAFDEFEDFDQINKEIIKQKFKYDQTYLFEALKLQEILQLDLQDLAKYYKKIPTDIYGKKYEFKKDDGFYLENVNLKEIENNFYKGLHQKKHINNIMKDIKMENPVKKMMEIIANAGLGFAFTQHGIDVRIAFSNPDFEGEIPATEFNRKKTDEMTTSLTSEGVYKKWSYNLILIGGGLGVLVLIIFIFLFKKKK